MGGSIGTGGVLKADVIEINNWNQLEEFRTELIEGKIVFYNRPMNPTYVSTFMAYGNCVDQRHDGASRAVNYGAVGVIVRSMSLKFDNNPHTGSMGYSDSTKKIPAVAISTKDAHDLSLALKRKDFKSLTMQLN